MARTTLISLHATLALVAFLGLVWLSEAGDFHQAGLNVHNKYRKAHRVPALSLDSKLNAAAGKCATYYANKGTIDHSCPYKVIGGKKMGENLSWDSRGSSKLSLSDAVVKGTTSWYSEVKDYRYNGPYNYKVTGHFTQVVWKDSKKLGLGVAQNAKGSYVVALYDPPGNFNNAYKKQVFPKAG